MFLHFSGMGMLRDEFSHDLSDAQWIRAPANGWYTMGANVWRMTVRSTTTAIHFDRNRYFEADLNHPIFEETAFHHLQLCESATDPLAGGAGDSG